MSDARIRVPDPALMRRATIRMVLPLVVLSLGTFFTAGGISILVAGKPPGLSFAVGGAVAQLACIVLAVAALRVRSTLDGDTISRSAVEGSRRTAIVVRRVTLATIAALLAYGLARLAFGDPFSLFMAGMMGILLWFLSRGANQMRNAQDQSLSQS